MTLLPEFRAQVHGAASQRAARRRRYLAVRWRPHAFLTGVLRALPAVMAVAIVITIATVALLTLPRSRTPAAKSSPAHTAAPVESRPAWLKALERRLSVLRRPASAPTAKILRAFELSGVARTDLRFVHRVALPAGTVWIAPTAGELCVAFEPTGVRDLLGETCSATTQAERSGVRLSAGRRAHLGTLPGPGNPLVSWHAGVVPDDITSVRIRIGAGKLAKSAVRHNTFAITAPIGTPSLR
jgi:hypothetical protein